MLKEYTLDNIYKGKLELGDDLLTKLTEIVQEKEITTGKVTALGAVKEAVVSFYDQNKQKYGAKNLAQPLEIINLIGNISLKDGEPIIHAHIALGDEDGMLYGGHLEEGTIVFACEFIIEEYQGEPFRRGLDQETGLPLWVK
ncbi:DNA-binding protein [Natroniella sulfidigena]|uniref:PPC domain-containing DNA-binding protein n=1 Tax=Natroniella sulfidigena TaxID=723921 RepID=UPI00200A467C|nr:PPC domain-containing DNA-binding protein [Natroniella sulfidigena]MCK8818051.1 DNA-binding protein [Natroniella sulfidigena]